MTKSEAILIMTEFLVDFPLDGNEDYRKPMAIFISKDEIEAIHVLFEAAQEEYIDKPERKA